MAATGQSIPLDEIDLTDPDAYVERVPHERFVTLKHLPVAWEAP